MFGSRSRELSAFGRLQGELDRLVGSVFNTAAPWPSPNALRLEGSWPPVNFWEEEGGYLLEAELPGLTLDEIDISLEGRDLAVQGARKPLEVGKAVYHRKDRGEGPFLRRIRLPNAVNAEKVHASLKEGVLSVRLPKAEAALPRRIPVTQAGA